MFKLISKMTKAELVAKCKEPNLSAGGRVKLLQERLRAFRASQGKEALEVSAASQQPFVSVGSNTIEAILVENFDIDPEASNFAAADTCAKGLRNVLDDEGLTIHEQVGGRFAANVKGKTMFHQFSEFRQDVLALRQSISALKQDHQQQITANQQQMTATQQQITANLQTHRQEKSAFEATLAILEARTSVYGYRDIRNRFLSCYKRKYGFADGEDWTIIGTGNEAALGGDALFDATLYQSGVRTDFGIFARVYGFSYIAVMRFRRFTQFKLNARF